MQYQLRRILHIICSICWWLSRLTISVICNHLMGQCNLTTQSVSQQHSSMSDLSRLHHVSRSCLNACSRSGCVGDHCIPGCSSASPTSSSASNDGVDGVDGGSAARLVANPLELRFFQWDCLSECKYGCMIEREEQKAAQGLAPEKYDGKWPFVRFLGMQVRGEGWWQPTTPPIPSHKRVVRVPL